MALCLLFTFLGGSAPAAQAAEADFIPIHTRAELEQLALEPSGRYRLMADIDMKGEPWQPLAFYGELDGNGHTIINLHIDEAGADRRTTLDGNNVQYDTAFAGLFSILEGAHVHNLALLNAVVNVDTPDNCFAAGLSGYVSNSLIENITLDCRIWLSIANINCGVGGLAGFCVESQIENCNINSELVFLDANQQQDCEQFLGGCYASGYSTVNACAIKMRGWASIYGYAHNGGVAGMYKRFNEKGTTPGHIANCTVDAEITFFENAPKRRAYCESILGENLRLECRSIKNKVLHFKNNEQRGKFDAPLLPESCPNPNYKITLTLPTAKAMGCCKFTCTTCGHSYIKTLALPRERRDVAPKRSEGAVAQ